MPTIKQLTTLQADLVKKLAKKKAVSLSVANATVALETVNAALAAPIDPPIVTTPPVLPNTPINTLPTPPSQNKVLQVFEPKVQGLSTRNLKDNPAPGKGYGFIIRDEDAKVSVKSPFKIRGYAPGMKNVEVYMKNSRWGSAIPGVNGLFEIPLDLGAQNKGPLFIDILAWDSVPGDNSFTTHLKMRITLFVTDGKEYVSPVNRTLVTSDEFTTFSALDRDTKPRNGERWLTNLANYKDYGEAAFEHLTVNGQPNPRNPYTNIDGFLRIRATHDDAYVDPYNYGRKWAGGTLSAAFPNGETSIGFRRGYIEARMSVPSGAGVWPAFWMLTKNNLKGDQFPALEPDVIEYYGFDAYSVASHWWKSPAEGIGTTVQAPNITADFHTYGFEVTDTEWIYYFDNKEVYRHGAYPIAADDLFYPILTFGLGGGWPVDIPEGKHYDMWVDYVRLYK